MKKSLLLTALSLIVIAGVLGPRIERLQAEVVKSHSEEDATIYSEHSKWTEEMRKYEGEWVSPQKGCKAEINSKLQLTVNSSGRWEADPHEVYITRQMDFLVSGVRYELFAAPEPEPFLLLIRESDQVLKHPDCLVFVRPASKNIAGSEQMALSNGDIGWRKLLIRSSKEWECSDANSTASINYRTIKFVTKGKLEGINGYNILLGEDLTFWCKNVNYRVNLLNDSPNKFSLLRSTPGQLEPDVFEFVSQ